MKKAKSLKVCLISSSGGHLAQLKQLIPVVEKHDFFFVTEKNQTTTSLQKNFRAYYLRQQDRKNPTFLVDFFTNLMKSLVVLMKENPDVIISTGAGAVIPMCVFGKILGKKVIFIESFAKIKSPTMTGRLIYKFADEFYIQWEDLRRFYPKAKYKGVIY